MEKQLLNNFISKYNMDGTVNAVTWTAGNGQLTTKFISDDKSVIGLVKLLKDVPSLNNNEVSIFETGNLSKLLGVLGDRVDIDVVVQGTKPTQLKLTDSKTKIQFALADPGIIPTVPKMKYVPDNFDVSIKLTSETIATFVKAKSAMAKVMLVAVDTYTEGKVTKARLILGDSDEGINTDKIVIPVETSKAEPMDKMFFNADAIKSVLSANKEADAEFEVSKEGLARMQFKSEKFESTYYFVAKSE